MKTIVLATTNPGKKQEFETLLALHSVFAAYELTTPDTLGVIVPPIEETGTTFAENAWLKAEAVACQTGCLALADDSGLCVDALGGAPGLYSARWAGPNADDAARTVLLLAKLTTIPETQRTARFVCALALARPDGQMLTAEGVCEGLIAAQPQGQDGFGYDPVFLLPGLSRTLAQLSPAEKNRVSHRAQAVAHLAARLQTFFP